MAHAGNAIAHAPRVGTSPSVLTQRKGARIALALLVAVWLAAGLFGRDPWKPDEAYSFGLVHHILQTGDWVVPTLAGEPFMEKPPLFFVSAAAFARAFGAILPLHDAARLAAAFYAGLTLLCVWLTARRLSGSQAALAAVLVLMGSVGYFHTAHLLVTDNSLIAGVALALYGLALHAERPVPGGIVLGTGTGVAFLSKGLIGPGMIGLSAAALFALPAWRTRAYVRTLLVAAAAFAPWALIWPLALYERSPELFYQWLVVNNLGRFTGSAHLGPENDHWMYLKVLPWFALPALPLAAWSAWRALRARDGRLALPLVASGVMLAVLSSACNARYVYALPMFVPLAIAAGPAAAELPRLLSRGLVWLAAALGGAAVLALWAGWGALLAHWPASIADTLLAFRPQFSAVLDLPLACAALAATLGAFLVLRYARKATSAVPLAWAVSTTLAWTLFFTLWLPYQDYGNSYRELVADMKAHLPGGSYCIANRDLGEPQRAMFEYFGGIVTHAEASGGGRPCDLLIVQQQGYGGPLPPHDPRWLPLWRGARPGDVNERFWLFASAQVVLQAQQQKVDPRVGVADAAVREVLQPD
jgi:4-amino-4-deoxy-L-arabinose transferase-like glycosyltransferase